MSLPSHLAFQTLLGRRAHLGVTGSVAAFKALELLRHLVALDIGVGATLTDSAQRFVTPLSFRALGADPVFGPMFEEADDPFGHLQPMHAAQALVVAPATADILSRLARGAADTMLACQALAFSGPIILAPAMNPGMWNAPATRENVETLIRRGVEIITPASGVMACRDLGEGKLADVRLILAHVLRALSPRDLAGRRVLVSLGPTREYFDAVRFWSNPSTGTMGGAVALAAWLRGADVTVVRGPCDCWLPGSIAVQDVTSAGEMYEACTDLWPSMDIACMTAAVADFAPEPHGPAKFKKAGADSFAPRFHSTEDILATLGRAKTKGQYLIGFAAETDDLSTRARAKLERKNLDLIIGNLVGSDESGFAHATNRVHVLTRDGRAEDWPVLPKTEVAWRIWDIVCAR